MIIPITTMGITITLNSNTVIMVVCTVGTTVWRVMVVDTVGVMAEEMVERDLDAVMTQAIMDTTTITMMVATEVVVVMEVEEVVMVTVGEVTEDIMVVVKVAMEVEDMEAIMDTVVVREAMEVEDMEAIMEEDTVVVKEAMVTVVVATEEKADMEVVEGKEEKVIMVIIALDITTLCLVNTVTGIFYDQCMLLTIIIATEGTMEEEVDMEEVVKAVDIMEDMEVVVGTMKEEGEMVVAEKEVEVAEREVS